jgi:hypothetical protein
MIVHIPAALAEQVWPDIEHFIRKATDECDGRFEPEDVLAEVVAGHAHLWVVWNEETRRPEAAMTTKIIQFPRKRVCLVQFTGGENMPAWVDEWMEAVQRYARECGCASLETVGRRGWARIVPDVKVLATNLIKDL